MTTRDAYFFSNRAQATSARLNNPAVGWLGVARNSSDQNLGAVSGATGYDITGATETVFVHTNRMVVVHATATVTCTGSNAGATVSLAIIEGGTTIGRGGEVTVNTAGGTANGAGGVVQLSGWAYEQDPGNGTHTYKLQLFVHAITAGAPSLSVAGTSPAWATILIRDDGAAS